MTSRDQSNGLNPSGGRHAGIYDRLPEYAMRVVQRQPRRAEWQEVEYHLATCAECRAELEELCAIIRDTAAGSITPAPSYPEPDLSFLNDPADQAETAAAAPPRRSPFDVPARLLEMARTVVIELSANFLAGSSTPALAGNFRSGGDNNHHDPSTDPAQPASPPQRWDYHHPQDEKVSLGITVEALLTDTDRKLYRIVVTVDDARDPLPEYESEVTLQYASVTRTATTDMGMISFPDIPQAALDQMRVTIAKFPPT